MNLCYNHFFSYLSSFLIHGIPPHFFWLKFPKLTFTAYVLSWYWWPSNSPNIGYEFTISVMSPLWGHPCNSENIYNRMSGLTRI